MQKLMGKPWSCWNLPEQPTESDLRKIREAFMPPDQYRVYHQSTPLPPRYISLFGTHPDSDFLSITTCPACGWRMKMQHANKHFRRDSRGAIVCKDSDLAIFESKVLGKAVHPVGELTETYSKKITVRAHPPKTPHGGRGTSSSSSSDLLSRNRSSTSSNSINNKTDYFAAPYRSRSSHSQMHAPTSTYMAKGRSSATSSTLSSSSHSKPSSGSLSKPHPVKSHSSSSSGSHSSSSWSSKRSPPPSSKSSSSSHKPPSSTTSGSYTLSIPSDDLGQNETVEDLLMSNISHSHGISKHVHIIATSNASKSKSSTDDRIKFYSDIPEKRPKLDSHSRGSDHHHKSSSSSESQDLYGKSKQPLKHSSSSSSYNGAGSSHSSSLESSKKSSKSSSNSSSKNGDSGGGGSTKHQLRSTSASSIVTMTKPVVSVATMSSGSSSSTASRSHGGGGGSSSMGSSGGVDRDRDRDRSSPQKKKKRKRDKDEPRKIIPLKERDFNPDKHCGVCVQGTSLPCKRSLTCKTHSVALRRAVIGRSQSFDALLAAHKLAKSEEKGSSTGQNTIQKPKDVVDEPPPQVTPPKPKKKKMSGSSHALGSSPNDVRPLSGGLAPTSYDRSGSPDIQVVEVKTKPKPISTIDLANQYGGKFKACPLIYPMLPESQAKFEMVWYNPSVMDRSLHVTTDEKNKFLFLMKHYKNPFFLNSDVAQPLAKNVREKRNVFSNWNASEIPVEGSLQHTVNWTSDRRHNPELDDEITYITTLSVKQ